jgi:general secretion pathway protein K
MAQPPRGLSRGVRDEQGAVLLLVLLVLALISVLVLTWAQEWHTELKLTANFLAVHQSRRMAEGGVFYAIGKLVQAQAAEKESTFAATSLSGQGAVSGNLWQGDQQPHSLELPEGKAEIIVANESGKVNLNSAPVALLRSLFTVLGVQEPTLSIMVDSIEDWRTKEGPPHTYGAKSNYYLRLNPPYVAKNGKFETVEELAWVRGFEANPLLPRLGNWLTVLGTSNAVNINTAPLEVLVSLGFPPEAARTLIATRQTMPFKTALEYSQFSGTTLGGSVSLQKSHFFTITSTGQSKNQIGRYTIKAAVRVDINRNNLWEIISWFDGFPSS